MEPALIILLMSCVFLVIGIIQWQKGNRLLKNGKKAEAIVFENNFKQSRSGGTYYPVVRFSTDKQAWITQELSTGYLPAKEEGSKLQVIYDPDDPTIVEINAPFQLEVLPRLFVALGIIGLLWGTLEYLNIIELIPS